MDRILGAGYVVTNDLAQIDVVTWDGVAPLAIFVDGFESGTPDAWSVVVPEESKFRCRRDAGTSKG